MNLLLYGKFFGLVTGIGAAIGGVTYAATKKSTNSKIHKNLEEKISELLTGILEENQKIPKTDHDWNELVGSNTTISKTIQEAKDFCNSLVVQWKEEYKDLTVKNCTIKS